MTAIAVACAFSGSGMVASAAPGPAAAAFCARHPNVDNPAQVFYGPGYAQGRVPPEVTQSGANTWRCMSGRVWVCNTGADGYACQQLDPNPAPSRPVRDYCAANPGADFVPMVVIGNSATTWRCSGRAPHALQTQSLDRRGFIRKAWRPLRG